MEAWKDGTSHNNDEEVSEREREEAKTEERERERGTYRKSADSIESSSIPHHPQRGDGHVAERERERERGNERKGGQKRL